MVVGWLAGREGARLLTVILRSVCVDPDSLCRIARFPHKSPLARVVIPTFLHNWLPRVFLLQLSSSLRSHPSCATQLSTPTSSSYPDTLRRHTLTSWGRLESSFEDGDQFACRQQADRHQKRRYAGSPTCVSCYAHVLFVASIVIQPTSSVFIFSLVIFNCATICGFVRVDMYFMI